MLALGLLLTASALAQPTLPPWPTNTPPTPTPEQIAAAQAALAATQAAYFLRNHFAPFAIQDVGINIGLFAGTNHVKNRLSRRFCNILSFLAGTLPLAGYSGWVISASEHTAVESAELPPFWGSDRRAAHYYRAQHARAMQREECLRQKAQAAERIIVQLQVLIGWLVQQIRDLQRQLAWLKQQQFGRKKCLVFLYNQMQFMCR